MPPLRNCQNCGREFSSRKKTARYCSKLCVDTCPIRRKHASDVQKGRKLTPEHIAKLKAAKRPVGPAHHGWKGDKAGYITIHSWLYRHYPKSGTCENCGAFVGTERYKGTEYANISGEYKRDRADFRELCVSCHRQFDHAKNRGTRPLLAGR